MRRGELMVRDPVDMVRSATAAGAGVAGFEPGVAAGTGRGCTVKWNPVNYATQPLNSNNCKNSSININISSIKTTTRTGTTEILAKGIYVKVLAGGG